MVMLPSGLGLLDLASEGEGDLYFDMYDDPEFEQKIIALDDAYYEDELSDDDYEEQYLALEKEFEEKSLASMDAGDRFVMGMSTPEEKSQTNRYSIVAAVFSVVFSLFQYFNLATRGQTIGKMFMDIKLINECTQEVPGHNPALLSLIHI